MRSTFSGNINQAVNRLFHNHIAPTTSKTKGSNSYIPGQDEVQQQHNDYPNGDIYQTVVQDPDRASEARGWGGRVLAQDEGVGGDEHEEDRILERGQSKLRRHKGEQAGKAHDGVGVAGNGRAQHDQIPCKNAVVGE